MQRIRRFLFRGSLNDVLLKKTFSPQKSQVLGAWYDFTIIINGTIMKLTTIAEHQTINKSNCVDIDLR